MGQMESAPLLHSVGPFLGSLVVASLVGGVYVLVRGQLIPDASDRATQTTGDAAEESAEIDATEGANAADPSPADAAAKPRILAVLPDDERRILEPVVESPGLTQSTVADRSGFSRSKVSQTVTDLEERGLLYREPQGRTYRVYPADDLDERA